mmetsp:Transcript_1144/g.4861  ORF Transcript_1144/g.4861 Transcript_1144/m.4861 type:complete len:444 (+) Transcript_1144:302-1633(+)
MKLVEMEKSSQRYAEPPRATFTLRPLSLSPPLARRLGLQVLLLGRNGFLEVFNRTPIDRDPLGLVHDQLRRHLLPGVSVVVQDLVQVRLPAAVGLPDDSRKPEAAVQPGLRVLPLGHHPRPDLIPPSCGASAAVRAVRAVLIGALDLCAIGGIRHFFKNAVRDGQVCSDDREVLRGLDARPLRRDQPQTLDLGGDASPSGRATLLHLQAHHVARAAPVPQHLGVLVAEGPVPIRAPGPKARRPFLGLLLLVARDSAHPAKAVALVEWHGTFRGVEHDEVVLPLQLDLVEHEAHEPIPATQGADEADLCHPVPDHPLILPVPSVLHPIQSIGKRAVLIDLRKALSRGILPVPRIFLRPGRLPRAVLGLPQLVDHRRKPGTGMAGVPRELGSPGRKRRVRDETKEPSVLAISHHVAVERVIYVQSICDVLRAQRHLLAQRSLRRR